ncbi:hypothetical protein HDC37_002185 [Microbacterium sp. AK009]|uniref:hypothetical protein n=1 Tax=Microbacterium sp. AK009 TaxID=2723068 RepID=UPI0015CE711A|nr:hypothetical protein [Microbacterium sp. AK009]NYF17357.1 hypothetical protein [Microbacterium sp. AK009]
MKVIVYAGSEFLTGDDLATALLEYSESLGAAHAAHIVEIPVREPDGSTVGATFLVGPASQIVVKDAPLSGAELSAPDVVAQLQSLTREQRPVMRVASESGEGLHWGEEF